MLLFRLSALCFACPLTAAFVVGPVAHNTCRLSTTAVGYHRHLSEIDEMCIENAAAYCVENDLAVDCDLDEHEALLNTLHEQRDYHLEEIQTINSLLGRLRGERPDDEPRASVIRHRHLSEVDEMCVENAAAYCLEAGAHSSECDLDEIEALITTLQEQDEYHLEQVETINSLLSQLEGTEPSPARETVGLSAQGVNHE